jgi:UDPglucose--hexose-1-phosphate uridylyltransferase
MDIFSQPNRRYNQLTGEWVLVSPHRTDRPWQGKIEEIKIKKLPEYDGDCYLCPGNMRANRQVNPEYTDTFIFDNDFPAILPKFEEAYDKLHPLLKTQNLAGVCRVLCFSPRHDLTLGSMELEAVRKVIDLWASQIGDLGELYNWVQVFENRGEMMGCSNPHPHCQIWATTTLPNEAVKENQQQKLYWQNNETILLQEYAELEIQQAERLVLQTKHWVVVVPFWAVWPFETLVIPRRHVRNMPELTDEERDDLASVIKRLLHRYDNLFGVPFPYSMGWHGAPYNMADVNHWQLHAHYYPPLLRSATVRKFMVGYEMLAEPQRDITPEFAAEKLREVSRT